MPVFDYRARNNRGEYVKGTLDSDSPSAVAEQLKATGLLPLDIKVGKSTENDKPLVLSTRSERRAKNQGIKPKDIMLFSRQMSTLQKAGVPILAALQGLQDSTTKVAFIEVIRDLRQSLVSGRDLASTLARHPKEFSDFFVSMVRVGEMTGQLSEVFYKLYGYLQFEEETKGRVKAALRYPMFIMIAITLGIIIMNVFVIPVFAQVFASFNAELPLLTRGLIGMSNFVTKFWWVLLGMAGGAWWSWRKYLATTAGRLWWDRKKLVLPIAGPIVLKTTLARFCSSLAMALKAGVPISQSLAVVGHTLDNEFLARRLDDMRQNVERGDSFYVSVKRIGVFPPMVLQMIAVGEETGELDAMLNDVADMYNRETEYEIKGLSAAIEPIMLVIVGVMVLLLALGIFLPLWSLGQAALGK